MGLLIDGVWHDQWYDTKRAGGAFERAGAKFRRWVSAEPGAEFAAAPGRYHLYVSLACPWAHRTIIMRKLKRLEDVISLSIVDPYMGKEGWVFSDRAGCIPDTVNRKARLYEIYLLADPAYSGRCTVPVLWDKEKRTIVSNESSEIIRMFNNAFAAFTDDRRDFYPPALRAEIDEMNAFVYDAINNGVYKCGFATAQAPYEKAFDALFAALDRLEAHLAERRFLVGEQLTEADIRLFTTLARFDPVYVGHFKCNLRRLADYRNLSRYFRGIYETPRVAETVNLAQIKEHYYRSQTTINPSGVVPKGPALTYQ